jgi:aldehyde:ferredoxin oxidoreductase
MFGRVLKIDLSTGKIHKYTIPSKWAGEFIGGSGLAARLLWDEIVHFCGLLVRSRAPAAPQLVDFHYVGGHRKPDSGANPISAVSLGPNCAGQGMTSFG